MKLFSTLAKMPLAKSKGPFWAAVSGVAWLVLVALMWVVLKGEAAEKPLYQVFGRLHLVVVHLPIALLCVVAMMEALARFKGFENLKQNTAFLLWLGVAGAIGASLMGFLLMRSEDYAGSIIELHMWTGLATVVAAVLALYFKLNHQAGLYGGTLTASVVLTLAAGHFGGDSLHGKNFIVRPLLQSAEAKHKKLAESSSEEHAPVELTGGQDSGEAAMDEKAPEEESAPEIAVAEATPPASLEEQAIFDHFIMPVLEAKCTECHNENKIKGKLRLDTYAMIMAGAEGADYPTVEPGNAEDSELIYRCELDPDDSDFMPPDGKDPLTVEELQLLKWWITGGASETLTVAEAAPTDEIRNVLLAVEASFSGEEAAEALALTISSPVNGWDVLSPEEQASRLQAAQQAAAEKGFSLTPVSSEDSRLTVSCVNAVETFGDAELALLEPVAENILWLDLARTQVTDAGLATVAKMSQLQRLHLEKTAVSDDGIAMLAGLRDLEYLNLYGTAVTERIFEPLSQLLALRKLYLYETKVDPKAAWAFQRSMSLEVNTGHDLAMKVGAPVPRPVEDVEPKDAEKEKAAEAKKPAEDPKKVKEVAAAAKAPGKKPEPKPVAVPAKEPAKPAKNDPVKLAGVAPKDEAKPAAAKPEAQKPVPAKPEVPTVKKEAQAPKPAAKKADAPKEPQPQPKAAGQPKPAPKPEAVKKADQPKPAPEPPAAKPADKPKETKPAPADASSKEKPAEKKPETPEAGAESKTQKA